LSGSYW